MDKEAIADKAVQKIIDDLTDRRGLKGEWHQIDPETQKEIRDEWSMIIVNEIRKGTK